MDFNGHVRRRYRPPRGEPGHTYAAIDLGSNNCRLLIARPSADGFSVIDGFSRIVRLGEGVHANGRLRDDAIERTVAALRICAGKMRRRSVDRARCVATEACRRARNGPGFLARVRRETGIALEVIEPEEEVRLALNGCLPLVEPWARHVVVLDVGGGSTELSWFRTGEAGAGRPDRWVSLPCGVVSLAETYGGGDVSPATYDAMVGHVGDLLRPFERRHAFARQLRAGGVQAIGTSGTVTTLAALHLGLSRYDRARVDGTAVEMADLRAVIARLRAMTLEERARTGCIGRDRADLVLAGGAILEAVLEAWPVERLSVADRGLREGMLLGLIAADRDAASAARGA